jgi:hypothetical protein
MAVLRRREETPTADGGPTENIDVEMSDGSPVEVNGEPERRGGDGKYGSKQAHRKQTDSRHARTMRAA